MSYLRIKRGEIILYKKGHLPAYVFNKNGDCIVSRYVRRYVDGELVSNPHRVKGYLNSVDTDTSRACHIISALSIALAIDGGEIV